MSQHLKSRIIRRLKAAVSYYPPHADISASHARGVRYFVPVIGIDALWGAMNTVKEGRHYKKTHHRPPCPAPRGTAHATLHLPFPQVLVCSLCR